MEPLADEDVCERHAGGERSHAHLSGCGFTELFFADLKHLGAATAGDNHAFVLHEWRPRHVDQIEAYCLGDVRLVYEVFLRIEPYSR